MSVDGATRCLICDTFEVGVPPDLPTDWFPSSARTTAYGTFVVAGDGAAMRRQDQRRTPDVRTRCY